MQTQIPYLQVSDVSNHVGEQGIAGNIEGNTQPHVSRPLVQLARQLPIGNIELTEAVAGRQGHLINVRHIPGTHDDASVIRVVPYGVNYLQHKSTIIFAQ